VLELVCRQLVLRQQQASECLDYAQELVSSLLVPTERLWCLSSLARWSAGCL
jgi:alpha-D-ribose 1-methylphosphonate 5-triphosphate synthase subunit PhnL